MKKHLLLLMRFSALVVIIMLLTYPLSAQVRQFDTNNGFTNSLTKDIVQDSIGNIWVATQNGLNKFDGIRITNYYHNVEDSLSISNDNLRSLYVTKDGRLWIGSSQGIQYYDAHANNFHTVIVSRNGKRIYPHITCFLQTSSGDLLCGTSCEGILTISQAKPCVKIHADNSSKDQTSAALITSILEDNNHELWVATDDRGLYRTIQQRKEIHHLDVYGLPKDAMITSLIKGKNNQIIVSTLHNGLFIFGLNNQSEEPNVLSHHTLGNIGIKTLCLESTNNLLIGTEGEGILLYDIKAHTYKPYNIPHNSFALQHDKVHHILIDNEQNYWIGTYGAGVLLIPQIDSAFGYISPMQIRGHINAKAPILSITGDNKNRLWLGTDSYGLFIYDKQKGTSQSVLFDSQTTAPNTITALLFQENIGMWVGTYAHGLYHVAPNSFKAQAVNLKNYNVKQITCFLPENKTQTWVATFGAGLLLLTTDPVTKEITIEKMTTPSEWVYALFKDRTGRLWMSTGEGIYWLSPKTKKVRPIISDIPALHNIAVTCITQDCRGYLWIGSHYGLYCIDPDGNDAIQYTTKDGLCSNGISGLSTDADNNLWVSTLHGVSKFDIQSRTFTNYYAEDGLQGNEFYQQAIYKSYEGIIHIGGLTGVSYFKPLAVKRHVENYTLNLISYEVESVKHYCLPKDDITIQIPHGNSQINLAFSTFNMRNSKNEKIQYRIPKLNKTWTSLPNGQHDIIVNHLPPGEYQLEARALLRNHYTHIQKYSMYVLPPWYATIIANILWTIITLLLLFFIYRFIHILYLNKTQRMKYEHTVALNQVKFETFTNISHDIRTPITMILSPLEKIISEKNKQISPEIILTMYRNAKHILDLVNQLLDVRKIETGHFPLHKDEINVCATLHSLALDYSFYQQKKKVSLDMHFPDEEIILISDKDSFLKIVHNILSNAFKYTPSGGQINVYVEPYTDEKMTTSSSSGICLRIQDTGRGIEDKDLAHIFERFYQPKEQTKNSESGIGIGLHLTKSLIDLLQGTIKVESSTDGSGTCFTVTIPSSSSIKTRSYAEETIDAIQLNEYIQEDVTSLPEVEKTDKKQKKTILVVDDDIEMISYISDILKDLFYVVEKIEATEALDYLLSHDVDCIVSDLRMPHMDGLTFCKEVRKRVRMQNTPFILLSSQHEITDQVKGLDSGVDAYIGKPFNEHLLISTINRMIQKQQTTYISEERKRIKSEYVKALVIESPDEIFLRQMMKAVNQHLSDANYNVQQLADEVGISRVHLHRKLKKLTGQSASDYIRTIRLDTAKDLLTKKAMNISDVAYAVGFKSLSHFSHAFKNTFGIAPGEFAKLDHPKETQDML